MRCARRVGLCARSLGLRQGTTRASSLGPGYRRPVEPRLVANGARHGLANDRSLFEDLTLAFIRCERLAFDEPDVVEHGEHDAITVLYWLLSHQTSEHLPPPAPPSGPVSPRSLDGRRQKSRTPPAVGSRRHVDHQRTGPREIHKADQVGRRRVRGQRPPISGSSPERMKSTSGVATPGISWGPSLRLEFRLGPGVQGPASPCVGSGR